MKAQGNQDRHGRGGYWVSHMREIRKEKISAGYLRLRSNYGRKLQRFESCRKHFLELMENVRIGVLIIDLKGRIVFFNSKSEDILGFARKEMLNSYFRSLLSLDDLGDGFKIFYDAIRGVYTAPTFLRMRRRDRSTIVCEVQTAPFYFEGRLQGGVAIFSDVADRKRVEDSNKKRVENFVQFSREIDEWRDKVNHLKKEVNELLTALGKVRKYEV